MKIDFDAIRRRIVKRWPKKLGRVRTSTVVLIVAFFALAWVQNTYRPHPEQESPVPVQPAPSGMVPAWIPQTQVYQPPRTYEPEPTTTPATTTMTTIPETTPEPTPTETPPVTSTESTPAVPWLPPWLQPQTTTARTPTPGAPTPVPPGVPGTTGAPSNGPMTPR